MSLDIIYPSTDGFSANSETEMAKISEHEWKERPKISKVAKFESQCRKLTKMYIRKFAHFYRCLFCLCVGQVRTPQHTNVCKIS